jgi:hypothetical protein
MPTRKQRKRAQKERRHEYETVWVDSEGNELEEPPDDAAAPATRDSKPAQKQPQRRSRPAKTPFVPSWRRSAKRSLILGAVIFVMFSLLVRSKNGQHQYLSALSLAVIYTALFIPFTYYFDRFIYRRAQRKAGEQPTKRKR